MTFRYDTSQKKLNDYDYQRKQDIQKFIEYAEAMKKQDYDKARKEVDEETKRLISIKHQ